MEILQNKTGQAIGVKFDEFDSIKDISSTMKCTSFELVRLMNWLKENNWSGEEIEIKKETTE